MLKKVALVLALLPAFSFASTSKQPMINLSKTDINNIYVCQKYNDNRINSQGEFVGEDSGVLLLRQEIKQSNLGFTITANKLFEKGLVMENPVGGSVTGMAGNNTVAFFKRQDNDDKPYFILYMTGPSGGFERVMYIADCVKE